MNVLPRTFVSYLTNIVAQYSSVNGISLGVSTEAYSTVIFLDTEEYIHTEEDTLFSCSACSIMFID
jgi:hypothetical protein